MAYGAHGSRPAGGRPPGSWNACGDAAGSRPVSGGFCRIGVARFRRRCPSGTAHALVAGQLLRRRAGRSSETLSTLPAYPASGTVTVDQIYVRYQVPVSPARPPLVFIHGCCLTGKTWETTPDGRMGWDEYFVRRGFPVYVIDQSWRGRSAGNVSTINAAKAGKAEPGACLPSSR